MAALLAVVGLVVGFSAGLAVMRSRASAASSPRSEASPASEPASEYALIEGHRDGVVVTDQRGRIAYRNRVARELQGTHVGVLVDESIDRHVARALSDGRADDVLELYGPPRVVLVLEAQAMPDGGVVIFIEDVSEQRRVDQVRTDFVANISHELKTPVGAMSVLAETLEGETDPATVERIVERMVSEAQRATRTIDDLMELSQIESGAERSLELVRPQVIVAGALDRVTELAARHRIEVADRTDEQDVDGLAIRGDRGQLVSALGNLVENAVKYSEPGGRVCVSATARDDVIEYAVIDRGVGIPQLDRDRIFERFYRVDRGRSRATGGTGLGLSIVRHVATSHGGEVTVDSAEGEGSTFTLRLPAEPIASVDGTAGSRARLDEENA
jgi:two-component system sensor histidine kinase SenX3